MLVRQNGMLEGNGQKLVRTAFRLSGCVVGVDDSCPMGFTCEGMTGQTGFCVTESVEDPGCCSTTSDGRVASLVSLLVMGVVLRRRRRR